ncbi:reverse transcriptase domain-containing protein [Tanacetum coccineum]
MSAMANTTPIMTIVTKPATKEKSPKDADATPRVNIHDFCEEHYKDFMPIIMDKIRRQTPGIVLTVEAALTGETLLTEIILRAETAPAASKNHMIIPAPPTGWGPNMDVTPATETAPVMRKKGGKVNPCYLAYRRVAPAMEDTGNQNKKGTSIRMRMTRRYHGYVERWAMPTWCHMFNSTLIGAARVWFDELPPESIDGYKDLKAAFLAYFMQQKKYVKDPVEIYNIKQRDGETIEEFMKRFKCLNEHVPKTMEEMMIATTALDRSRYVKKGRESESLLSRVSEGGTSDGGHWKSK